jgi:GNAT superfamily N-acetyltransferase
VEGTQALPGMSERDIQQVPDKTSESYKKIALLIYLGKEPVGFADLHVNHRTASAAYIGLLLLIDELHGKGLGRKAYNLVENYLVKKFKIKKIFLGVSDQNRVERFWQKMGFVPNGFEYKWKGEKTESNVAEFEKSVD